ncbi:MAG TPA: valine--tRNA ligase [Candidatus Sulfomarinibacteraceae bacterium]|nr:valine--tRNA ligase [Candidatus Sulfomarinibacteraceae bacterium]
MVEMPKAYDFKTAEDRLYEWWEENGWFRPEVQPGDAEPFVISIPPPNVTGELHMGHAMFVALEDLMIRRARMQGYAALWVPGTDHAGIATQLQVEKLLRSEGTSRREVGREEFLRRTWEWKEKYGGYITQQLRRLGASCDWSRERFTLDEGLNRAVNEAFVRLHRMGLIYRGEYLVNWSPGLQTAVSDLEVEYHEEPGSLYYFNYPVKEGGSLPVATTRPETILGDTAVAVHPEDDRFQEYVGKTAIVPVLEREIPIIADKYVDVSFGTGALKITPGHDPNDFEIGRKHDLEIINVMNRDATMNENAGPYAGLDRFEARRQLWHDMGEQGLAIRKEPYTLNVPRSQRGGEIVEPLVSRQWFVDAEPMAKMALEAVRNGRIRIVPERFNRVWENWLENIRPWCISRQLWWGHRIPVWYVNGDSDTFVVAHSEEEAYALAAGRYGKDVRLEQDPDVLDTWFSSALWPFSTLGWPQPTEDLQRFYPTDVMETGYDILFFWVARMVMTGLLFTNDIPFHTVYLHGLVRDEQGRKMSKTTGNVVDPLEVIDQYGTDALRFTLLTGGTPGNDLNLSLDKVASNRNFANKIWNLTRFIVKNLERMSENDVPADDEGVAPTTADRWILTRLNELIDSVDRLFDGYLFGEAGRQIYEFLWGDFADWYVESAKVQFEQGGARAWHTLSVLYQVLDASLRLMHPYIPYVTEATWQELQGAFAEANLGIVPEDQETPALIVAPWPSSGATFPEDATRFERLRDLIRNIRAARAEYDVAAGRYVTAYIAAGELAPFFNEQRDIMIFLARLDDKQLIIDFEVEPPQQAVTISLGDVTCYLPLAGMVDLEQEQERLNAELAEVESQIERLNNLLDSPFSEKAPEDVVAREREKLERFQAQEKELQERLADLGA